MNPNRSPSWPPGVVGSITHCDGFVGAVVGLARDIAAIGFDVEPASGLDGDLVPIICTPEEITWAAHHAPKTPDWPKILFSAKEAIHKCISPVSGVTLDFRDVNVRPDPIRRTWSAELRTSLRETVPDFTTIQGRFRVTQEHVLTSAYITVSARPFTQT